MNKLLLLVLVLGCSSEPQNFVTGVVKGGGAATINLDQVSGFVWKEEYNTYFLTDPTGTFAKIEDPEQIQIINDSLKANPKKERGLTYY